MKLFSIIFFAILITYSCFAQEKLGKELTLKDKTDISEIINNPDNYIGKKVLVEGEILAVCQNAGCWMEVANKKGDKIRVKVKDGEIIFPKEGLGKTAIVEGEVYKIEMNEKDAREYFEHMAEESNKEFDASTITGPVIIYQIKGIGAVID